MLRKLCAYSLLFWLAEAQDPSPPPLNERCDLAYPIQLGFPVIGNTALANFDGSVACGSVGHTSTQLWYAIQVHVGQFYVSTCSLDGSFVSPFVTVYAGTRCGSLTCLTTGTQLCGDQWFFDVSAEYTTYYLMVHGNNTEAGPFSLMVVGGNDIIDNAVPTACGGLIYGDTQYGTADSTPACGGVPHTSPQLWYVTSVPPNGRLGFWVCDETNSTTAAWSPQVSVYYGQDPSVLECVGTVQNACNNDPVVLPAGAGTYWLMVHGTGSTSGLFSLQFVCLNEFCPAATPVTCGASTLGDTRLSTHDFFPVCGPTPHTGAQQWYYIDAPAGQLYVSLCNAYTAGWQTALTIFKAPTTGAICDNLSCMTTTSVTCGEQTMALMNVEAGRYYIMVHGVNRATGQFQLDTFCLAKPSPLPTPSKMAPKSRSRLPSRSPVVSKSPSRMPVASPAPGNSFCDAAIKIQCGQTILGDTTRTVYDESPTCNVFHTSGGQLWYYVDVLAGQFTASLCDPFTNFDTQLTLVQGSVCSSAACMAGNDNACGKQSLISLPSVTAGRYYLRVHGANGAVGKFALTLTCATQSPSPRLPSRSPSRNKKSPVRSPSRSRSPVASPSPASDNQRCLKAAVLQCGKSYTGNTLLSSYEQTVSCNNDHIGPQLWYYIQAPVGMLTVSLCNANTKFDTQLTVFSGKNCNEMACVAGSDQACGDQSFVMNYVSTAGRYYVMVHGRDGDAGKFRLDVSCDSVSPSRSPSPVSRSPLPSPASPHRSPLRSPTPAPAGPADSPGPSNDKCAQAINVGAVSSTFGDTDFASMQHTDNANPTKDDCVVAHTSAQVWYSVDVGAGPLSISLCNADTNFDTRLTLFKGTNCGQLQCVAGADQSCGLQSMIYTIATAGRYYFMVHGFEQLSGQFRVDVVGTPVAAAALATSEVKAATLTKQQAAPHTFTTVDEAPAASPVPLAGLLAAALLVVPVTVGAALVWRHRRSTQTDMEVEMVPSAPEESPATPAL